MKPSKGDMKISCPIDFLMKAYLVWHCLRLLLYSELTYASAEFSGAGFFQNNVMILSDKIIGSQDLKVHFS